MRDPIRKAKAATARGDYESAITVARNHRAVDSPPRLVRPTRMILATQMSSCFKCGRYSVLGGTTLTGRTPPVKSARKSLAYGSFGYQSSTTSNRQPYGRRPGHNRHSFAASVKSAATNRGAAMGEPTARRAGTSRPSTSSLGRVLRACRDRSSRGRLDQRYLRSADRGPGPGGRPLPQRRTRLNKLTSRGAPR
jgi:hypothetical protein